MARGKKKKRIKYIGRRQSIRILLVFLVLVLTAFFFFQSPYFNVSAIAVTGNSTLSEPEAKKLSGITMGTNIFRVDTQAVKEKLLLNPFVASAEIKRVLPHTISIKISEYDPMAVVPVAGSFMQVSKEGYCLSYSPEISDLDLPVVSGLNIKNKVSPGSKIQNKSLLVAMKILEYCNKDSLIAEVDAHDVSRLSLFTYSKTKILLGNERQLEDKISLALEIASKVPEAQYIDVRFPKSPVYK